jgi:hypothetical protein
VSCSVDGDDTTLCELPEPHGARGD